MAEGAQPSLLIDEEGNIVGVSLDGSVYRLEVSTKIKNTSNAFVNPATETTLATLATDSKLEFVRLLLLSVDSKDFATETGLSAIDAILNSIKDTDGVKKITDPLPAGDNNIGNMDVVTDPLSIAVGKVVVANYAKLGVATTSYYMLIDLDGGGYPHGSGTRIIIAGAGGAGVKSSIGSKWAVQLGVVLAIDGTSATIGWLPVASISLQDTSKFAESQILELFPNVMDLAQAAGAYTKIASNLAESGITEVNTGITLEDALGNNVTPAVGDMVLRAELNSGAGTLDFKFGLQYWVE